MKAHVRLLKNRVTQLVVGGIVVGTAISFLMILAPWMPAADSKQADRTDLITWGITYISFAIFGLVFAVLAYSMIRFRRRGDDDLRDGAPIHGHTGLEVFWTFIPVCIVTAFGIWAAVVLNRNEAHASGAYHVIARGQQYSWTFIYPQNGNFTSDQLVVPLGRTTEIETQSTDVVHSFFVAEWRVKADAVPGQFNRTFVTPTRTGTFHVLCAELCGPGHAGMSMTNTAKVVQPAEFESWLARQQKQAQAAPPGKKLFASEGCAGCHTFAPAGATGKVGPDLDGLAAAAAKANVQPTDFVHESIVAPNAYIAPGFSPNVMPQDYGTRLSTTELHDLVDYLLHGGSSK